MNEKKANFLVFSIIMVESKLLYRNIEPKGEEE